MSQRVYLSTTPAKSPTPRNFGRGGLRTYLAFSDQERAFAFEKYLKSGSGRAFAKKHLQPQRLIPSTAALSRSRNATISFFIASNSGTEHSDAAKIDGGTARALSFSA